MLRLQKMQAELEAGAPIESFNAELESMLALTGGGASEILEDDEERKGEQDSEIFYECASTNEGLASAAEFVEC